MPRFAYMHKCNYIHIFTVKLYGILKVQKVFLCVTSQNAPCTILLQLSKRHSAWKNRPVITLQTNNSQLRRRPTNVSSTFHFYLLPIKNLYYSAFTLRLPVLSIMKRQNIHEIISNPKCSADVMWPQDVLSQTRFHLEPTLESSCP
jgi:hypothetical protein